MEGVTPTQREELSRFPDPYVIDIAYGGKTLYDVWRSTTSFPRFEIINFFITCLQLSHEGQYLLHSDRQLHNICIDPITNQLRYIDLTVLTEINGDEIIRSSHYEVSVQYSNLLGILGVLTGFHSHIRTKCEQVVNQRVGKSYVEFMTAFVETLQENNNEKGYTPIRVVSPPTKKKKSRSLLHPIDDQLSALWNEEIHTHTVRTPPKKLTLEWDSPPKKLPFTWDDDNFNDDNDENKQVPNK